MWFDGLTSLRARRCLAQVRSAEGLGVDTSVLRVFCFVLQGALPVRGALLTKESDSSFAEEHRVFLSEPTHIEGEVEDQEDEM